MDEVRFAAGRQAFERSCAGCHHVTPDPYIGPHLDRLFGREIASVAEFDYSESAIEADVVWNEDTLETFLRAPLKFLPGSKMGTAGIQDDAERDAIIYYLFRVSAAD